MSNLRNVGKPKKDYLKNLNVPPAKLEYIKKKNEEKNNRKINYFRDYREKNHEKLSEQYQEFMRKEKLKTE